MKRFSLVLAMFVTMVASVKAMPFEEARMRALYLTDKMAYELNLNSAQMDYVYEINLDYFLGVNSPDDVYGPYLAYRNENICNVLMSWQYNLFVAADYFFRPVCWRAGAWFYPITVRYPVHHYYYARPSVYLTYYGGRGVPGRPSYYAGRRPHWNGGMRGHHEGVAPGHPGHGGARPGNGGSRPGHGDYRPSHNDSHPGQGLGSHPGGNQSHPGGNQSRPGGNQSRPGGNQSRPGGNDYRPGQNNGQSGNHNARPARVSSDRRSHAAGSQGNVRSEVGRRPGGNAGGRTRGGERGGRR